MSASKEIILELKDVTKHYGKSRGVEKVNIAVEKGEIFGFLGPNGAGKSTSINMILDIIRPTRGDIYLFNKKNKTNTAKLRQQVAYVAGDMEVYAHWTGRQFIEFCGRTSKSWSHERAEKIAKDFSANLDKKISQLSRGNKQKINLIAAFARQTELLILDEPTSGLDPLMQQVFYKYTRQYKADGGTVFMSSHILEEVQELCDKVAFIRDGKIVAHGDVQTITGSLHKRITVRAPEPVLSYIAQKKLLSHFVVKEGVGTAEVTGHIGSVLKKLPLEKITDIEITPPSLEEIFLRYYKGAHS